MKKITSLLLALSMIIAFGATQAQSKKSHVKKAKTEMTQKKDQVKKEAKKEPWTRVQTGSCFGKNQDAGSYQKEEPGAKATAKAIS